MLKPCTLLACLLALTGSFHRCYAAPVSLVDVPSSYTPGQSFDFEVRLPEIDGLAIYQVDLLLSASTDIAGTSFRFESVDAANEQAVFDQSVWFAPRVRTTSPSTQRLTLSDIDLSGRDVEEGQNNLIATIGIVTQPNFRGDLSILIDAERLILNGPGLDPTPVSAFAEIQSVTHNADPVVVTAVPEPRPLWFAGISIGCVMYLRRSGTHKPRTRC